jgi:hypothetical protein
MPIKRDDLKLDGKVHIPEWGDSQAACAHVRVKYVRVEENGRCRDTWRCESNCGAYFWPSTSDKQPLSLDEVESRLNQNEDTRFQILPEGEMTQVAEPICLHDKPTHRDKGGNLRCECGKILGLTKDELDRLGSWLRCYPVEGREDERRNLQAIVERELGR